MLAFHKGAHTETLAPEQSILFQTQLQKSEVLHQSDPDTFYQTIIDNNIFRPLNWKPPQRVSAYELLGTVIATDGSSATAYIQERKSNQFSAVSLGQKVGKMTVETITSKQVTLTQNSESLTLAMSNSQFLNSRGNRSIPSRPNNRPPFVAEATTTKKLTDLTMSLETKQIHTPEEWRKHLQEKAVAIRSERIRMMERLKYLQQH